MLFLFHVRVSSHSGGLSWVTLIEMFAPSLARLCSWESSSPAGLFVQALFQHNTLFLAGGSGCSLLAEKRTLTCSVHTNQA